ncbi:putative perlucin-like [Scophthalmus maximus]|nr:putative perlucin-like [Scophthalmus maximus]
MQRHFLINPASEVTPLKRGNSHRKLSLRYRAMTMERTIILIFLCAAVEAEIGKHHFIQTKKTWSDAQIYCRKYYTDLSIVSSQSDQDNLLNAAGGNDREGWIGLYYDPNIPTWIWSGGAALTYQNWNAIQPDNNDGKEDRVNIFPDGTWNDDQGKKTKHFYCIRITVVEMRKSWEEALEHCREKHTDLPSLLSETDRLLAQKVIQRADITDPVWIGLRYLNDHWLWINSDPLEFKDWPSGEDHNHQCPMQRRCGALTKNKVWESWDCQDKLNFICI